jgi:hypothetical protein
VAFPGILVVGCVPDLKPYACGSLLIHKMFLVEVQNPYLLWSCASPKANFAQR